MKARITYTFDYDIVPQHYGVDNYEEAVQVLRHYIDSGDLPFGEFMECNGENGSYKIELVGGENEDRDPRIILGDKL